MSEQTVLQGELRSDIGKGASRRLRRLENRVPAIIYGGKKAPKAISLRHNKVIKSLENQAFYASVFAVEIDGKKEEVILKALQRHPYKAQILHMDLQRVVAGEEITKSVPLTFINEESAKGVKLGGAISKTMTEVEVKCQAKHLPSEIEVDLLDVDLEQTLHLSDIKLPKGVSLTIDVEDGVHDSPIVSIHTPKAQKEDVDEAPAEGDGDADQEAKKED